MFTSAEFIATMSKGNKPEDADEERDEAAMRVKKTELNILSYTNYRNLLEDYFTEKNSERRGRFSYRAFARRAGFKSPNYIRQIIIGNKNLSHDGIHRLADAMELTQRQREFFENLVYLNQSSGSEQINYYMQKVFAYREFAAAHKIEKDQYEYFSKWYYVAIRELVALPDFKMNLFWIAKKLQPTITVAQAKEAVVLLQRLKMIKQDIEGKWVATEPHLKTEDEVFSSFATNFHQEMIEQAKKSLEAPGKTREVSSVTMSINQEQFLEIKNRIARFRDEIQKYLSESGRTPNRVCQLNYQFFHLSQNALED